MRTNKGQHPVIFLGASLLAFVAYQIAIQSNARDTPYGQELAGGNVVISAPIQVLMYAGDRFLAANLEEMRVASIGTEDTRLLAAYRLRAYELVSQLNPCHEDNYYMANALLAWGGSAEEANIIQDRATDCRFWDEFPPFFFGLNSYFFYHDMDTAKKYIDTAARRSKENRNNLQAMSIAIAAKELNDERMAIAYLRSQRDKTDDRKLAASLDRRLKRLDGLILLRDAQKQYEAKYGHPLTDPNELLKKGILTTVPKDPMRIGYEFVDGRFQLRALNLGNRKIR